MKQKLGCREKPGAGGEAGKRERGPEGSDLAVMVVPGMIRDERPQRDGGEKPDERQPERQRHVWRAGRCRVRG